MNTRYKRKKSLSIALAVLCLPAFVAANDNKAPIKVLADSIFYSDAAGTVDADGKIEIFQDQREIRTESIKGDFKKQQYRTPGTVTMTNGPEEDLQGTGLSYDGRKKSAKFSSVEGFYHSIYLRGYEGEFVNNIGSLKKGMITTPHAMAWKHTPDYRVEAENITVYPGDKAILQNPKFFIKNWQVLTLPSYKFSLRKSGHSINALSFLPRPIYSSDNGIGAFGKVLYPLQDKLDVLAEYHWYNREGFRPTLGLIHYGKWGETFFGYREEEGRLDEEHIWIKKYPELSISMVDRQLNSQFTLKSAASFGRWYEGHTKGSHYMIRADFVHKPIYWGKQTTLHIGVGYQYDYYGFNDTHRSMPFWHGELQYHLNDKLDYRFSYRQQYNGDESPYEFDRYSFLKRASNKIIYTADRLNKLSVEFVQDWEKGDLEDVIYTYQRDLHSFEGELVYRAKKKSWRLNFWAKDF